MPSDRLISCQFLLVLRIEGGLPVPIEQRPELVTSYKASDRHGERKSGKRSSELSKPEL